MLHSALSELSDKISEAENVQRWSAFHVANEFSGSHILIHTYDRITSATIADTGECHSLLAIRDGGVEEYLLQNVQHATKLKGHDVRKPFEKACDQAFHLDPRTCKIEELGDGTYSFETTRGSERVYGFIFPRTRYLLPYLSGTAIEV